MTNLGTDKYSASEQGLGYIYQPRLALLRLLEFSEDTAVFLEKWGIGERPRIDHVIWVSLLICRIGYIA